MDSFGRREQNLAKSKHDDIRENTDPMAEANDHTAPNAYDREESKLVE